MGQEGRGGGKSKELFYSLMLQYANRGWWGRNKDYANLLSYKKEIIYQ